MHELGSCGVAAYGVVRATVEEIARLRSHPGPHRGEPFPFNLLKNSDEQTVVGLAALVQAIDRFALVPAALTNWGLIAAPRFFGRLLMAHAIEHFQRTGPSLVSPLIVPHRSLHAFVHAEFRAHRAADRLKRAFTRRGSRGRPASAGLAALALIRHRLALPFLRRRVDRLARMAPPLPAIVTVPVLSPQAAAIPSEQPR